MEPNVTRAARWARLVGYCLTSVKAVAHSRIAPILLVVLVAAGCSGSDGATTSPDSGADSEATTATGPVRGVVATGAGTSVPLSLAGPHLAV
ncbi:MAG: hypothetical protein OEV40_15245, partial [Acidimicrobiia bacterium]|nr:hypothetical protein [Acidimicrobiia bacterium]